MGLSASRLPADVIRMTFEVLDQPDVLTAAAVSRAWRASAELDASFYRTYLYVFDPSRHEHASRIDRFADVIRDAEQHRYRLSLTADIIGTWYPTVESQSTQSVADVGGTVSAFANDEAEVQGAAIAVASPTLDPTTAACAEFREQDVPLLRCAVPLLTRLNADVEPALASPFFSALSVPAPRLRSLAIRPLFNLSLRDRDASLPVLYSHLFAESAPLLRKADLTGNMLLRTAAHCLANVCALDVSLVYEPGLLATIAACFSRVRYLGLHSLRDYAPLEPTIDVKEFAAFRHLRSLYIGPELEFHDLLPMLRRNMAHISYLEICCGYITDELAPLLGAPAPHLLELHESVIEDEYSRRIGEYHSKISLRMKSAATVRCMDSPGTAYETVFRILVLASISTTLTNISIDDRHVRSLLDAFPVLPALERLSIILMSWSRARPQPDDEGEDEDERPDAGGHALPPDETFAPTYPRLTTLTLHGTRIDTFVPDEVLLALARVFRRPQLILSNGLTAAEEGVDAFASVQRIVPQFQRTAHVVRARRLLSTGARVKRAQSPGAAAFDSWWTEGFDFDSSESESE
ncbi:hypothetical protein AURDEDRAFT_123455 [Auricularia subglabra TFB-10046 SS5]|nr:hypothetical protein AURDEDRAFT_123455 [Auricularia subglabra TFB-10046 SS5]